MEVWTYFEGSSGWGTTSTGMASFITNVALAFGGASGGAGESGTIYNGVNSAYGTMGMAANQGDTKPSAYLNYILFDKEYKLLDMGWKAVPATANMAKQQISIPTVNIKEAGYIFVYLSYEAESNNWVYFDDFKVTHTKTNVIQYNEYYPFGLQASKSWTRENSANNFLYNAGSELNTITGWYETFFRGYDATLGRFSQVDPLAYASSSHSPYNYGLNDPVYYNDPMGDYVEPTLKPDKPQGGSLRNYPGITGFDTYVAELYGGDPIPGYGGEMSAPSGTTEFSIGGVTITIDWSQVGADGLSINMNDDGSANSAMIFQDEGGAGFWIDYAFGPGGGDVAVESHKSQFVSGWAQQGLMDVTDKFNEQLRQTEKFFNDMGIAFDAMDMPYPGMTRAMKLDFFKSQVGTKKPYDIKQPGKGFSRGEIGNRAIYNGVEYNYDDFGNINYGVAARALGLTYLEAVAGAGYNQTFQTQTPDWSNPSGFFDHSRDTQMINFGFNMLVPKK